MNQKLPTQHILRDCRNIIFEYYIHKVHSNVDAYSKEDLQFFTQHIRCWEFCKSIQQGVSINVNTFLKSTRGKKRTLYYVEAEDNGTIGSETFEYFRGIHELIIPTIEMGHHESEPFCDEDLAKLRGIHSLNFSGRRQITNAAFIHLRGIHTLSIKGCFRVTDSAFEHLRGIHTLNMNFCNQVSDAALVHLRGIHTLHMFACHKITDNGLENLRGIHTFIANGCHEITSNGLVNLRGVHTLHIANPTFVNDEGFENLRGIKELHISEGRWSKGLEDLRGIQKLNVSGYVPVTRDMYSNLRGIKILSIGVSTQDSLVDADLQNLVGINNLELRSSVCCEPQLTSEALTHLRGIQKLRLVGWNLNDSFVSGIPPGIKEIDLDNCHITCASLDAFCGSEDISFSELRVETSELQQAQECLNQAKSIRGRIMGSGAQMLLSFLNGNGCKTHVTFGGSFGGSIGAGSFGGGTFGRPFGAS